MKQIFKQKKMLILSVLIILLGISFTVSYVLGRGIGFSDVGGLVLDMTECSCSTGYQVEIEGYPSIFSGTYLYLPEVTQVKGKGVVESGRQILGKYSSGGECLVGKEPDCTSLPITKGTLEWVGTN